LLTVTMAVPLAETSDARMAAWSTVLETRVVARGEPFQLTTEPDTKPLPRTVSVNPAPVALLRWLGLRGIAIRGIGLF